MKRIFRLNYILFFSLLLRVGYTPLIAQLSELTFSHITIGNGLMSNEVRVIIQDQKDFIWIGMEGGLNRYDGSGMMPEMDGFEVCRRLKSDKLTSHIPIVLLTAKATQEDKVAGLSHGADAYLTKPFDKEELLTRLKNLSLLSKRLQEKLTTAEASDMAANPLAEKEIAFLKEVNEIITSNLDNELFNTEWLCREIAMSRTQLHRKLKALTNQSTANYIRSIRLTKAKSFLETTDMAIGEISLRVGFKDFSHFSRMFLREFGVQPSRVREKS